MRHALLVIALVSCGSSAPSGVPQLTATAAPATARPTSTIAPATVAPQTAAPSTARPTTPALPQVATVRFVSVTSPIGRNAIATVRVATSANAACTIRVTYNSGPSNAAGLEPKAADGAGAVAWSWMIGGQTAPGTYPIDVTCAGVTARAMFTVQ